MAKNDVILTEITAKRGWSGETSNWIEANEWFSTRVGGSLGA